MTSAEILIKCIYIFMIHTQRKWWASVYKIPQFFCKMFKLISVKLCICNTSAIKHNYNLCLFFKNENSWDLTKNTTVHSHIIYHHYIPTVSFMLRLFFPITFYKRHKMLFNFHHIKSYKIHPRSEDAIKMTKQYPLANVSIHIDHKKYIYIHIYFSLFVFVPYIFLPLICIQLSIF